MLKAMKWSPSHRDIYSFDGEEWLKVQCNCSMNCTAPDRLPRGTKFDYNVKRPQNPDMLEHILQQEEVQAWRKYEAAQG